MAWSVVSSPAASRPTPFTWNSKVNQLTGGLGGVLSYRFHLLAVRLELLRCNGGQGGEAGGGEAYWSALEAGIMFENDVILYEEKT